MIFKEHKRCRACGSDLLIPVFDLGVQPLANAFRKVEELRAPEAPLIVLYCENCTLAQLSVVVDPLILYRHYQYTTPTSITQRDHIEDLSKTLTDICHPESAIEIGSNSGDFLAMIRDKGCHNVWGVEPSSLQAEKARDRHDLQSVVGLFEDLHGQFDKTDLVIARHVFCHVDNWKKLMVGLEHVSHKDTLIAIEVPSVRSLLSGCLWDTIYHEHTSYLTLHAMKALLEETSLRIDRVLYRSIHGGSVVFLLRHKDHGNPSSFCVGCHETWVSLPEWSEFSSKAIQHRERLIDTFSELKKQDANIIGYGAPAKASVMVNYCRWNTSDILFITDTTPEKVGRLLPGTQIRIEEDRMLTEFDSDFAILFAWPYEKEIRAAKKEYTGTLINPHTI